jgi:hypothetical protein
MAKKRFKGPACANCGAHYLESYRDARFCPACGQENHDLNVPLRHLIAEAAEGLFHFDTKSVRTLRALAFRPGFLTVEFLRGRRVPYVMPVRLYVFVSFLFFLVLALFSGGHGGGRGDVSFQGIKATEIRDVPDSDLDAFMQSRRVAPTPFNRYAVRQLARISRGGQAELRHLILKSVSYMMFALMPIFALVLLIFFRKNEPHYIASLIFSLHYHSLAFLVLAVLALLSGIFRRELILFLAPIVMAVYLFLALRTVYGRSSVSTLFRTIAIGLLHVVLVLALFLATLVVRILLF